MGDGRNVLDHGDLKAGGLQGADGGLAPGAGALDVDVYGLEAILLGMGGGGLRGRLGGKRRGLLAAAETKSARGSPGQGVAVCVGDEMCIRDSLLTCPV